MFVFRGREGAGGGQVRGGAVFICFTVFERAIHIYMVSYFFVGICKEHLYSFFFVCMCVFWVCKPVIAILADHLLVPSRTLCFTAFIWPEWLFSSTLKTSLLISRTHTARFVGGGFFFMSFGFFLRVFGFRVSGSTLFYGEWFFFFRFRFRSVFWRMLGWYGQLSLRLKLSLYIYIVKL